MFDMERLEEKGVTVVIGKGRPNHPDPNSESEEIREEFKRMYSRLKDDVQLANP